MRKAIYYDMTSEYNLRCIHCDNAGKYFKEDTYSDLSMAQIKYTISRLYKYGFNYIHFLGGEPLLS